MLLQPIIRNVTGAVIVQHLVCFRPQVIANLKSQRDEVRESHRAMLQRHHEGFHSTWGQLTKTGYSNSRFAHQASGSAWFHRQRCETLASTDGTDVVEAA